MKIYENFNKQTILANSTNPPVLELTRLSSIPACQGGLVDTVPWCHGAMVPHFYCLDVGRNILLLYMGVTTM